MWQNLPFDINWWSNMPFVRSFCGPDFDFKIDEWSTEPFVRSFITWHWHTAQRWKLTFHALLVLFLKLYFWRASPTSGVIFYVQEATIFWLHLFFCCKVWALYKIPPYENQDVFFLWMPPGHQWQKMTHTSLNSYLGKEKNISHYFFGDEQKTMIQSSFYLQQIGLFFGNI